MNSSVYVVFCLSSIISIAALVCLILVVIKLFQKEGVGLGILGIFCGIYTFVWGWINHKEQKLTTVMIIWSAVFVLGFLLSCIYTYLITYSAQ